MEKQVENSINSILSKLAIATRLANEKIMSDIGLHAGQAQILISLFKQDGKSQAELARDLGVSAPTVNKIVSKLSEAAYVKTRKCEDDSRLMRVHLTAIGARIQPRIEEKLKKIEVAILKGFTDTERVLIPMILERLHRNLYDEVPTKE